MKTAIVNNFSWSYSRMQLFNSCRKAYFYRYYASAGGGDEYSSEKSHNLYLLKQLQRSTSFFDSVLLNSLKELFLNRNFGISSHTEILKSLSRTISLQLYKAKNSLLTEDWRNDLKAVNLFETYYNSKSINEIISEASNLCIQFITSFSKTTLFSEMCNTNYLKWTETGSPESLYIDGIRIWFTGGLIYSNAGIIKVIIPTLKKVKSRSLDITSVLNMLLVSKKHYIPIENICCMIVHSSPDGNLEYDYPEYSAKDIHKMLSNSVPEMLEFDQNSKTMSDGILPKAENHEQCNTCQFKGYCL